MRAYKRMPWIAVAIWFLGTVRLYKDGDGVSVIFRFWHPVTWLLFVLMIIPCAFSGEKITELFPLRLSKFWKMRKDQMQWITPFTDLHSLPPVLLYMPAAGK